MPAPSIGSLEPKERRWLLALARRTIEAQLAGMALPEGDPDDGPLIEHRGAFVTLTAGDRLRGCIGHVLAAEPLWISVRSNAVNAAFHDPRFTPVTGEELPSLVLEISALSPLWEVSEPAEIVVGRDGLTIEKGRFRGLLLPQVASRYGWTPEEFLDQTCLKAGLNTGDWRDPSARIGAFSAEVFSEEDPYPITPNTPP
jgi:AmmeMemoRadiSam system protein A